MYNYVVYVCLKLVVKQGREKDAVLFAELHRRLSSQGVWRNTWAILHLLLVLADEHTASPAHSMVRAVFFLAIGKCVCN